MPDISNTRRASPPPRTPEFSGGPGPRNVSHKPIFLNPAIPGAANTRPDTTTIDSRVYTGEILTRRSSRGTQRVPGGGSLEERTRRRDVSLRLGVPRHSHSRGPCLFRAGRRTLPSARDSETRRASLWAFRSRQPLFSAARDLTNATLESGLVRGIWGMFLLPFWNWKLIREIGD